MLLPLDFSLSWRGCPLTSTIDTFGQKSTTNIEILEINSYICTINYNVLIYYFMKKKIIWGFYPEEPIKIQSIIEIIIYTLIFSFCLYLYHRWYDVPRKNVYIRVENLGTKVSIDSLHDYCNLYYTLPMTKNQNDIDERISMYGENAMATVRASFYTYKPHNFRFLLRPSQIFIDSIKKDYKQFSHDDFEFKSNKSFIQFYERVNPTAAMALNNSVLLITGEVNEAMKRYSYKQIDSLRKEYQNYMPLEDGYKLRYIYSEIDAEGLELSKSRKSFQSQLSNAGIKNGRIFAENYAVTNTPFYIYELNMSPNKSLWSFLKRCVPFTRSAPNEKPSIFTKEDISQAYISLKLESVTIDSINLKFDFVGATDFSRMNPEPDEIGFNYIEFRDPQKIAQISLNGLTFLARFKDLEGLQQIRLFTVTAIMSGLFTIFIVFAVLYIFKLKRAIIYNRKESNNTNSSVSPNEEFFDSNHNNNDDINEENDNRKHENNIKQVTEGQNIVCIEDNFNALESQDIKSD